MPHARLADFMGVKSSALADTYLLNDSDIEVNEARFRNCSYNCRNEVSREN
jgi:hypothetical protein